MNIVIKYNKTDKRVIGTETFSPSADYSGLDYGVVVSDVELHMDSSKHYYIDTTTMEITSQDKPVVEVPPQVVRARAVEAIIVTTGSGKEFDGDESSQSRMSRAIQASEILGQTDTLWKLADNSAVSVTVDELKEALALALQEQSRIWMA